MRETSAFGEDLEAVFRSCFEGGGGLVGRGRVEPLCFEKCSSTGKRLRAFSCFLLPPSREYNLLLRLNMNLSQSSAGKEHTRLSRTGRDN